MISIMMIAMAVEWFRDDFSSPIGNHKLTPTTLGNVDLADDVIRNKQVALKVVTLYKIKDPEV